MKKNISLEQASNAISCAKDKMIIPACTFIMGMPGETKETIMDSVKWIRKNKVRNYTFFFATPYPGCELYNEAFVQRRIEEKYKNKDNFFTSLGDAITLTVNMTNYSDSDLIFLRYWAEKKSANYLQQFKKMILRIILLLKKPDKWRKVNRRFMRYFSHLYKKADKGIYML